MSKTEIPDEVASGTAAADRIAKLVMARRAEIAYELRRKLKLAGTAPGQDAIWIHQADLGVRQEQKFFRAAGDQEGKRIEVQVRGSVRYDLEIDREFFLEDKAYKRLNDPATRNAGISSLVNTVKEQAPRHLFHRPDGMDYYIAIHLEGIRDLDLDGMADLVFDIATRIHGATGGAVPLDRIAFIR